MADGTGTLDSVSIDWLNPPRHRHDDDVAEAISYPRAPEPLCQPLTAPAPLPEPVATVVEPQSSTRFVDWLRRMLHRPAQAAIAGEMPAFDPLTLHQRLYGRGYVIPGDAAWVLDLVEPFQLDGACSILDLAAGLGGPARTIAQAFHAKVTGLERDYERAKRANAMSSALGAAHLVKIRNCDPEAVELPAARFDGALGREATYALAEKERFLRVVAQSLRTRGQIVLTDFALDRSAGERDELGKWQEHQSRRTSLWTAAQYADCFRSVGYGLRHTDDISALYRRQIIAAWVGYLRAGAIRGMSAAQVDSVLTEAESCCRTVAALESGALKYYRFQAIAHYSFW
jgi:SAM-dependent methyltransferase